MAGSARFTAILDACVLYPAPVRDALLSLAAAGLYHARWTDRIQAEWVDRLLERRPDLKRESLTWTVEQMATAVPGARISRFEPLESGLDLPDPQDRHVLAAAIKGHADAIVTFNLKDFPQESVGSFEIEVQHPDDFILNQLELHEIAAIAAIKAMRARLRNPTRSAEELARALEGCQLPQTAAYLRQPAVAKLI